jgi:hypothetical protein
MTSHWVTRVLAIALVLLTVVLSLEIAIRYERDYAVPWNPLSESGLSELQWIRNHFGYNNPSVIVVIRDLSSYLWMLAYTGDLSYFGNVLYLLNNQTSDPITDGASGAIRSAYVASLQRLSTNDVLRHVNASNYRILVPSALYGPDPIERQILTPIGGDVYAVRESSLAELRTLLSSWNSARTSGDMIEWASPLLKITPLVPCNNYSRWTPISNTEKVMVGHAFNASNCSLHVEISVDGSGALYVQLAPPSHWNLGNETYLGFYFQGAAHVRGTYSLTILLSKDNGFTRYYFYTLQEPSIWDGNIHGILIPLDSFDPVGAPLWTDLGSINVGVYTSTGGTFAYDFGYAIVAR